VCRVVDVAAAVVVVAVVAVVVAAAAVVIIVAIVVLAAVVAVAAAVVDWEVGSFSLLMFFLVFFLVFCCSAGFRGEVLWFSWGSSENVFIATAAQASGWRSAAVCQLNPGILVAMASPR
jgi:hypothetical protein